MDLSAAYESLLDPNSEYHREERNKQFSQGDRFGRPAFHQHPGERVFVYRGPGGEFHFERFEQQHSYQYQYQYTSFSQMLLAILGAIFNFILHSSPIVWVLSLLVLSSVLSTVVNLFLKAFTVGSTSKFSVISYFILSIAAVVIASMVFGIPVGRVLSHPLIFPICCIGLLFSFVCCIGDDEDEEVSRNKSKEAVQKAREAAEDRSHSKGFLLPLTSSSVLTESSRINIVILSEAAVKDAILLKSRFRSDPISFYMYSLPNAVDKNDYPSAYAIMKKGRKWTEFVEEVDGELESWVLKVLGVGESVSWEEEDICPLIDTFNYSCDQ